MSILTRKVTAILMGAILFAGCGMFCACAQSKPPRGHYEQAGAFSFDPPPGWKVVEFPGLKYHVAKGPHDGQFAPNINVVDEPFSGTLTEYVALVAKNVKKAFASAKTIKEDDFRTEDGLLSHRLVMENVQQGSKVRQTFFFFGNATRKYVATCTMRADGGEAIDTLFSRCMKTFRLH